MAINGTGPVDPQMLTMMVDGAKDDASSRSMNARSLMEGFLSDAQSIMGIVGGLLQGVMGMLGKGGGGMKGGKGGGGGGGKGG